MQHSMSLVGLDVHAAQTHAAILDMATGELRGVKLRMAPVEVVGFLAGLPGPVRAVYEAGPTGFGLARAGVERGLDVRVVAAGKVPRASGDRIKTDKRDAERLARLLAAGELRFAFVPSVADEQFRDVIRAIEDCRGDLMRARHRCRKLLLRRDLRWAVRGPRGRRRTCAGCSSLRFDDVCSHAVFVDYLSGVADARRAPRRAAGRARAGHPRQPARADDRAAALLPGPGHALGRRAVRRDRRLAALPAQATRRVSRDRPQRAHLRPKAPPGLDHQGRLSPRAPAAGRSRPPLPPPTRRRRRTWPAASTARTPGRSRSPGAPNAACTSAGACCASSAASPPASSRSPAPASSPRSAGRPPPWTEPRRQPRAIRCCRGARENHRASDSSRRAVREPTMGNHRPHHGGGARF